MQEIKTGEEEERIPDMAYLRGDRKWDLNDRAGAGLWSTENSQNQEGKVSTLTMTMHIWWEDLQKFSSTASIFSMKKKLRSSNEIEDEEGGIGRAKREDVSPLREWQCQRPREMQ